jgi:hypothetical protein
LLFFFSAKRMVDPSTCGILRAPIRALTNRAIVLSTLSPYGDNAMTGRNHDRSVVFSYTHQTHTA